ncbi:MAG: hypothetical protein CNIPEHKO_01138 [Anaerolineales bacterium]|nr:hypothetical protein [Anaerolineales bacterium]
MNDVSKEILRIYTLLDAKGKAAVLRKARRLLARQQKQIAASKEAATRSAARDKPLKQPKGF